MPLSPAWLLSTLAQSTAAIVGLTIAFTISSYTTRKGYVLERTDRYRDEVIDFKHKYQHIFDNMAGALEEEASFNYHSVRFNLDEDIESWAQLQTDNKTAEAWARISGVANELSNIEPNLNPELTREQLGHINKAAKHLPYYFAPNTDQSKDIFCELEDIQSHSKIPDDYTFKDIMNEGERVESWLSRYLTSRYDNKVAVKPGSMPLSGQNFYSWTTIFEELDHDGTRLASRSVGTELDDFMNKKFSTNIIITDIKLSIVGILIPSLLLISSPSATWPNIVTEHIPYNLLSWAVYPIQLGLILLVAYYTAILFVYMLIDLNYDIPTTMRDILGPDGPDESDDATE